MFKRYTNLIVIASHNDFSRIERLVGPNGTLRFTGTPADFLVVDNGSNEYYKSKLSTLENDVMYLSRKNIGRETGAFDEAERTFPNYERYMFLQDDTIVLQKDWLSKFEETFDKTPNCGAVGFDIYTGKSHLHWVSHQGLTVADILRNMFGENYVYNKFCGGAMLYTSRQVLNNLRQFGGIPHAVKNDEEGISECFGNERLFSSIIQNMGYEIVECPNVLANGWVGRQYHDRNGMPWPN